MRGLFHVYGLFCALALVVGNLALESEDIEIVGYGENCGRNSICDDKVHLACKELSCQCDQEKGFVYDDEKKECVSSKIPYHDNDSVEDDDEGSGSSAETEVEKWDGSSEVNEWKSDEKSDKETGVQAMPDSAKDEPVPKADDEQEPAKETTALTLTNAEVPEDKVELKSGKESDDNSPAKKDGDGNEVAVNKEVWVEDDGDWDPESIACKEDRDCFSSSMGQFSRCGSDGTCACFDTTGQGRLTLLINGTCYVWKELGSDCSVREECTAFISGPAWCHIDYERDTKFCTCTGSGVQLNSSACVSLVVEEGVPCILDAQCNAKAALGPMAICGRESNTCECGAGGRMVDQFCVQERDLGESCVIDQECQARNGIAATCNPDGVCACVAGRFCGLLGEASVRMQMSGFTILVLMAMVVLAMASAVMCLLVKRRVRYQQLQQV